MNSDPNSESWTKRFEKWIPKGAMIDIGKYVSKDAGWNEAKVRSEFVIKIKRTIGKFPLGREAVSMYYCMLDARTPLWVKSTVAGALAYFILPFDAVPDFIPLIGFGDDLGVLAGTLSAIITHITPEHRKQADEWIEEQHLIIDVEPLTTG